MQIQTVAALEGFFLAMALFPDVQRKAQEEIDRVFGKPTFPTMADREKLPYIEAVAKEALRWHTVANLGVPHRTDEDDIVEGHLIPRDAMLIPNIWYLRSALAVNSPSLLIIRQVIQQRSRALSRASSFPTRAIHPLRWQ